MCGKAIERGWENVGNWLVSHPQKIGLDRWVGNFFNDFSSADESDDVKKPETRFDELRNIGASPRSATVVLEDFGGYQIEQAKADFEPAATDVAPGFAAQWNSIASTINSAVQNFGRALTAAEANEPSWTGRTKDAAIANVRKSLEEPQAAAKGAQAMSILVDAFSRTITTVRDNVMSLHSTYDSEMSTYPQHQDEIRRDYAAVVQKVMREAYVPNIDRIAQNNPGFTANIAPAVGPVPGGSAPGVGGAGGGSGGGMGGAGGATPPKPNVPKLDELSKPASLTGPVAGSQQPSMPQVPNEALSGLTGAAQDAAGQATDAAKQGLDAAKQGLNDALGAFPKGPDGGPPEGVLGLGPKGLSGAANPTKAGGAGGGGARVPHAPRLASLPVTDAARTNPAAVAPSRAGLSSGAAGAPGAGAPAAGQRGGADGKEHKANKALRRRKNGEGVIGGADAVVAVVGGEGKEQSTPESNRNK